MHTKQREYLIGSRIVTVLDQPDQGRFDRRRVLALLPGCREGQVLVDVGFGDGHALVEFELAVVDLVERQDSKGELEDAHHGHPDVPMDGGACPRRPIEHADRHTALSVGGHGGAGESVVQ